MIELCIGFPSRPVPDPLDPLRRVFRHLASPPAGRTLGWAELAAAVVGHDVGGDKPAVDALPLNGVPGVGRTTDLAHRAGQLRTTRR